MAIEEMGAGLANQQARDVANNKTAGSFWNKPRPPSEPQQNQTAEETKERDERPE